MSLNVVVYHVAEHVQAPDSRAADRLRNRLAAANNQCETACQSALPEYNDAYKLLFITQVNNKNYFGLWNNP